MSGFFGFLAFLAFVAFIVGMVKPEFVVFWGKKKTRGIACLYLVAVAIFGIIAGSLYGGTPQATTSADTSASSAAPVSASSSQAPSSQAPSSVEQQQPYSATLLPGYYEIGVDIPAGTYNFDIADGKGNVTDINDDVNLIMGNDSDDMYVKSYKNAKLTDGNTLFVQQCSINVSSSNAGKTKKRNNSSAKAVTLSSGKYTAGKDFQTGYYDITLVSGSGNVICNGNELNAIFSTDKELGVTTYKNVPFKDGNELDVESVQIKLTPSE